MGGGSFKYLIPGIIAVILLSGVILSNKFITKQSLGSIYNIDEAGDNFDNIQIGDSINYEINGYSDWQVIGKDDYEGTVDVVSKTNIEDLTLEINKTKEEYESIFQETANKYIDGYYAVKARTVNQSDLDYFEYDSNFWINNITETKIAISNNQNQGWEYIQKNYKLYVVPSIVKSFENKEQYNVGDIIEYSYNGIDTWVYAADGGGSSILVIPENPIEISIESPADDIDAKASEIINSFCSDVWWCGNYFQQTYKDMNLFPNLIHSFLDNQNEKIWFYRNSCYYKENNKILVGCSGEPYYENGTINYGSTGTTLYTEENYTLGYRPVVTLKVKEELQDKDKKEISNKLQVGDNVKYEAKGYKNWKVLSIDKDNNTVDIISGGIVKNLTLSGKEDWDNYEDIIQRELDEYKNGNNAKKATTVTSSHLKTLKEIDKSILARYWILSKVSNIEKEKYNYSGGRADLILYAIGTIGLYNNDNYEMYINNIAIFADFKGSQETVDHYKSVDIYINGRFTKFDQMRYTAGLRPVITLKLDSVEKLPEDETKKIEESTEKQEKVFIKEQESKNKDYKGPSKVDNSTSSTGNNEVKTNDNDSTKKDNITDNNTSNVEKIVYKDKPSTRYQLIIQYIIIVLQLGVIIYLLLKRKNN